MTHHPTNDPKATIKALQEQFKDLCAAGMRGAEAIASFGESPKESLRVVKDSDAEIKQGLSELKRELEAAKVPLANGEQIFVWEYQTLAEIASNAGIKMEEIEARSKAQNGSVMLLNLSQTTMKTLNLLAGLSSLRELDLRECSHIQDLTPLSQISSLRRLLLNRTSVNDLTPLSNLPSLEGLWLSNTQVSDLTPLAASSSLHELWLGDTPVRSLGPLAGLHSLRTLWLSDTQVQDIVPLAAIGSLERLWLNRTQVQDIAPLAGLRLLQKLELGGTPALSTCKDIIAALENRGVGVVKE